jgi:hypothetical protein
MKIKLKIYSLLLILLLIFSCSHKKPNKTEVRNEIKENCDLNIYNFEILSFEIESAIGDYRRTYTIQIDSLNFTEIQNQIQNSRYLDTNFKFHNRDSTFGRKIINRRWTKMPFGYKFEYYKSKSDETVLYEVGIERRIIICHYVKE